MGGQTRLRSTLCQKSFLHVDLFIILKTVYKVLKREGITEEGQATAMDLGDYLLANGMVHKDDYASLQAEAKRLLEQY